MADGLDTAVPARTERVVEPDPVRAEAARERLARFRGLHGALRTIAEPARGRTAADEPVTAVPA
jgi:hypothetical protein